MKISYEIKPTFYFAELSAHERLERNITRIMFYKGLLIRDNSLNPEKKKIQGLQSTLIKLGFASKVHDMSVQGLEDVKGLFSNGQFVKVA